MSIMETNTTTASHEHHAIWAEYRMSCECGLEARPLTNDEREAIIAEAIAQDGGR